mmetsp:Transcript_22917/g.41268  ORF Transcript_22917/g.41268 Transcript_22917/m.41268 type:complete len:717 (-) Transcript_22917:357-2507(-)
MLRCVVRRSVLGLGAQSQRYVPRRLCAGPASRAPLSSPAPGLGPDPDLPPAGLSSTPDGSPAVPLPNQDPPSGPMPSAAAIMTPSSSTSPPTGPDAIPGLSMTLPGPGPALPSPMLDQAMQRLQACYTHTEWAAEFRRLLADTQCPPESDPTILAPTCVPGAEAVPGADAASLPAAALLIARVLEADSTSSEAMDFCEVARALRPLQPLAPGFVLQAVCALVQLCRDREEHWAMRREVLEVLCLEAKLWDVVRQAFLIVVKQTGPWPKDTSLFNVWLQCARKDRMPYTVMQEVLRLMEDLRVPRDFYTFQCLLEHGPQTAEGMKDIVLQLYTHLEEGNVGAKQKVPAHCLLLRTYAKLGEWDVVDQLVNQLPPDPQVYETAVRLYGFVAKDIQKMEHAMQHMKSQGFALPPVIICTAIEAYGRAGDLDKINQIMQHVFADGHAFESEVYGAVAVAMLRMGRVSEVQSLLAELDKTGRALPDTSFHEICTHLVAHYGAARDFPMIHAILSQLRTCYLPIGPRMRRKLLFIYADSLQMGHLQQYLKTIWPLSPEEADIAATAYSNNGCELQAEQLRRGEFPSEGIVDSGPQGSGLPEQTRRRLAWRLIQGQAEHWFQSQASEAAPEQPTGEPAKRGVWYQGIWMGPAAFEYVLQYYLRRQHPEGLVQVVRAMHPWAVPVPMSGVWEAVVQCLAEAQRVEEQAMALQMLQSAPGPAPCP